MKFDQKRIPVVIDTNVLVPALYRETRILQLILKGDIVLIWNNFILEEIQKVSKKMFYNVYYDQPEPNKIHKVLRIIEIIFSDYNKVMDMPDDWPQVSRDRKDDPFLFAAKKGGAEYIISEDESHMLSLGSFEGIPIVGSSDFLKEFHRYQ